ncbi:M1 family aminopeptidase [Rufibacter soli]
MAQGWAQAPQKEEHPCAVTRTTSPSLLLADGITSLGHRDLMRQYDLHWYKLDLQLENTSLNVAGNVVLVASSQINALSQFGFELHPNFTIEQVLVDGLLCSVRRSGSEVVADLPVAIGLKQKFKVQVFYAGKAPSGASAAIGNGYNTTKIPEGSFSWSLSEPFAASEWFPVKQLLEDKADSLDVWVTTATSNKVGSNGLIQRVTPMGNQLHRYEWKSTYPIAYYLISVALGPYEEYSYPVPLPGVPQPMLFQNYIYPQSLSSVKAGIDNTASFLQVFSEHFGLYPFYKEKYGHSMAPIGGGMEHQTMTTLSSFGFTLTAHELAHQWWGDEVTCADWSHIWLNEGFATYSEYLALEKLRPLEKKGWLVGVRSSAASVENGMVFVKDSTSVSRIFSSALTYRKGAMVLHMLRHAVGSDALFFKILQAYRKEYQYKVATTRDFQKIVERETGKPYKYFFDQWVYGEGLPVLNVAYAQRGDSLYIRTNQTGTSPVTPFFQTEVEFKITTTVKDTLVLVQQNKGQQDYVFKVPGKVTYVEIDPNTWLLYAGFSNAKEDFSIVPPGREPSGIFPNPTSGLLTLNGWRTPSQVTIYDVLGKTMKVLKPESRTISVADLRAGAYVIKAQYGAEEITYRFIKL